MENMDNTIDQIRALIKRYKERVDPMIKGEITESEHDYYLIKQPTVGESLYAIAQLRDIMRRIENDQSAEDIRLDISYRIHNLESRIK